jgi:15-hydroxyprostaglandin dehydrogenase (NAD)
VIDSFRQPNSAVFTHVDVLQKKDLLALLLLAEQTFGKVDVMVNNAGIVESTPYTKNNTENWMKVIDIDLTAVILGTKLALDQFEKQNSGGTILNTASLAGLVPAPFQPVYAAAKAGVVNFSRSLGYLSKRRGVRVNAICPSFVKTALTTEALNNGIAIKNWVDIDLVTDAFMMCIEDSTFAGDVIRITPELGIDIPFRKWGKSKL